MERDPVSETISSLWTTREDKFQKSADHKHTLHFVQFPVKPLTDMTLVCALMLTFNVLRFKVVPHLMFIFNDPKSIMSVLIQHPPQFRVSARPDQLV
jgi:hypothetical protein